MKKIIISLALVLAFAQAAMAQDLTKLMDEMAKVENAQRQVIDEEVMGQAMQKENSPEFLNKMTRMEVVVIEDCPEDMSAKFSAEINAAEKSDGYESLMSVKEKGNKATILLSKKAGDKKDLYIYAISNDGDAVLVKMTGKFSQEDLAKIIEEQQNNMN